MAKSLYVSAEPVDVMLTVPRTGGVKMEADGGRAILWCSCRQHELTGTLFPEVNIAQTDVLASIEVVDVEILFACTCGELVDDTLAVGLGYQFARSGNAHLLRAQAIAPGHGFGFNATIGI